MFHDLFDFTSQSRRRLNKARSMSSKYHMIRANLLYRNLIISFLSFLYLTKTWKFPWQYQLSKFLFLHKQKKAFVLSNLYHKSTGKRGPRNKCCRCASNLENNEQCIVVSELSSKESLAIQRMSIAANNQRNPHTKYPQSLDVYLS